MTIRKDEMEESLKLLVAKFVAFPFAKVCKHWAAGEVLQLMESWEMEVSNELAKAVVSADDEEALRLLGHEELI